MPCNELNQLGLDVCLQQQFSVFLANVKFAVLADRWQALLDGLLVGYAVTGQHAAQQVDWGLNDGLREVPANGCDCRAGPIQHLLVVEFAAGYVEDVQSLCVCDYPAYFSRLASNVPQSPNRLLHHLAMFRSQSQYEGGNDAISQESVAFLSGCACDVGEDPACLHLHLRRFMPH